MTTEKQPARHSKETAAAHATARAERLARRLGTVTADDVLSMTAGAGMDAIEEALDRAGSITLPLAFRLPGPDAPPLPDSAGEDFLPIRLPRAVAEKIRRMCEVADIEGGVDAFVSEIIGNTLEATAADVLIDCWNIEDPAIRAQLFTLQAEAQEAATAAAAGNRPE